MLWFRNALLVGVLIFLQGCGFSPIYAVSSEDYALFQQIEISKPETRIEQRFFMALEELIHPTVDSVSDEQRYALTYTISASHSTLAIQQNQEVTRYSLVMTISYALRDIVTDKSIVNGRLVRQGGYDAVDSEYAVFVSRRDTETRVAKELAEDIKQRLLASIYSYREKHETSE